MAQPGRDGVALALEERGQGHPPLVFVHGVACHRGFWASQVEHFAVHHHVVAVDLRGHGDSHAPAQRYAMRAFADDVAWTCASLGIARPVLVGHSLGGLVALEFAAAYPEQLAAVVLIDSVLLPTGDRAGLVRQLVAALRSPGGERALRSYFATFFGPDDDRARMAWILDEAIKTPLQVTSSVWEESIDSWDDAAPSCAVKFPPQPRRRNPERDLARAGHLRPQMLVGRTIESGHFSPLEVLEQVNAMLERFLVVGVGR